MANERTQLNMCVLKHICNNDSWLKRKNNDEHVKKLNEMNGKSIDTAETSVSENQIMSNGDVKNQTNPRGTNHQCSVCCKSKNPFTTRHCDDRRIESINTCSHLNVDRLVLKLKSFVLIFVNILVNIECGKPRKLNYIYKWSSLGVHRNIVVVLLLMICLLTQCHAFDQENHGTTNARSSRPFSEKPGTRQESDSKQGNTRNHANPTMYSQSTCNSCMLREELRERNLEFIKNQVLLKLGFTQAPNITGKNLPKYNPDHMREIMELAREESFRNPSYWSSDYNTSGMQGDDPNSGIYQRDGENEDDVESKFNDWQNGHIPEWKEGIKIHEEDADDFHAKTEKVITFAQPYPRLRHGWKGHDILQFKFSDNIMKHKIKRSTLYVYVKPPKPSSVEKNRAKRYVIVKNNEQGAPSANKDGMKPTINLEQTDSNADKQSILNNEEPSNRYKRSSRKEDYDSGTSSTIKKVDMKSRESHQEYTISVLKVIRNSKNPDTPSFELVSSNTFPKSMIGKGKWKTLDITSMLSTWFRSPRENQGFVVRGTDSNGNKITVNTISDKDDDFKTPFAETYVVEDDSRRRRTRSAIGLDCNENSDETRCCRYPLTVDFQEFGWDWVIAPRQYAANYCSGECGYVFLQKYPHTHITSMVNIQAGNGPAVEHCCAPRKMSSITMLYFNNELNIIFGVLPNMVVERCGCV